jgi:hypothetical protein
MSTITAKNLATEPPRSPFEELDGIPWLARLIDKVRALQANTLHDYTPFPCGGDKNFLGHMGLDADALKAKIFSGASDAEILAWVKANMAPDAMEKLEGYKAAQRVGYPAGSDYEGWLNEAKAELLKARPDVDLSKADNFARLICVEEGHPLQ